MHNQKSKQDKHEQRRIKQLAAQGLEAIQEFFYHVSPEEALHDLWNLFHYSMISDARGEMTTAERADSFYFYDQLRQFLEGIRKLK